VSGIVENNEAGSGDSLGKLLLITDGDEWIKPSSPRPIFGRERVARLMASLGEACHELGVTLRRTEVNGQPGAMFFDRALASWSA
jgi:hypothetical protein